jgi:hypothetical protein
MAEITFRAGLSKPCPVCDSGSKSCSATADGLHLCRGEPGEGWRRIGREADAAGFFHYRRASDTTRISTASPRAAVAAPPARTQVVPPRPPATREKLLELAKHLQLEIDALAGFSVGWDGEAWTVPEVNGAGEVCGVHRRFPSTKKLQAKGSKRGLTVPRGWRDRPGPAYCVEGFSNTAAMIGAGFACVGRPNNTGGAEQLAGLLKDWPADRGIVIVGDNDQKPNGDWPGKRGKEVAEKLARALGRTCSFTLPPEGFKGVRDYLISESHAGRAWAERGKLLAGQFKLDELTPPEKAPAKASSTASPGQAQLLTELAASRMSIWRDEDGKVYAEVSPRRSLSVSSKEFRHRLLNLFRDNFDGRIPGAEILTSSIAAIEAEAQRIGSPQEAFVRVGHANGNVYLHLADEADTVVEVMPMGWGVCDCPPVRFKRPRYCKPLPMPSRGGSIEDLRELVNVEDDDQFSLLLGWLCFSLGARGPFPLMVFTGEHGSSKSTTAKAIKRLLDPAKAPLRDEPKNAQELLIGAVNCRVMAFDNISHLAPWLSDALCRLSTGGGSAARELYSDSEEHVVEASRPVLLTGIEDFVTRSDLLSRSIILHLPRLAQRRVSTESDFWNRFDELHASLLGAILDRVSIGLREVPAVRLPGLPRMADFARFAVACESSDPHQRFLGAYTRNQDEANAHAIECSSVAVALVKMMENHGLREWRGTPTELFNELNKFGPCDPKPRDWPRAANKLKGTLTRLNPNLRSVHGLNYEDGGKSGSKRFAVVSCISQGGDGRDDTACGEGRSEPKQDSTVPDEFDLKNKAITHLADDRADRDDNAGSLSGLPSLSPPAAPRKGRYGSPSPKSTDARGRGGRK